MEYRLSKLLKDGGFTHCSAWAAYDGGELVGGYAKGFLPADSNLEILPDPTLEELIAACEEISGRMDREQRQGVGLSTMPFITNGTTPEESVARLWLSLNDSCQ